MAPVPTLEADFLRWAEPFAQDGSPPRNDPADPPAGGDGARSADGWLGLLRLAARTAPRLGLQSLIGEHHGEGRTRFSPRRSAGKLQEPA